MGLRVYRHLNGIDLEVGESEVISCMPILLGENIKTFDFEIKACTTDSVNPYSKWPTLNYAVVLVSSTVALLYKGDDAAFVDSDNDQDALVDGTGFTAQQLNTLFKNLMHKQDSEGFLWYAGDATENPIMPVSMTNLLGSGGNESSDTPGPDLTYNTDSMKIDAGFASFGPRIVVPLREETIMDKTVITTSGGNARAEYHAKHTLPINGGFGVHGGLMLVGVWREALSGVATGADWGNGTTPTTDRFLLEHHHAGTAMGLSVGWSDQQRAQEIMARSGSAAGAWFRQLWAGDQRVENNSIFTGEDVNVVLKGRTYVDTPYNPLQG